MSEWDRESVYDEKIQPLMLQIIALCKEHHIPMVAQFQYADSEENGPAYCTTVIANEGVASEHLIDIARRIRPRPPAVIAETHETLPNGEQRITSRLISG